MNCSWDEAYQNANEEGKENKEIGGGGLPDHGEARASVADGALVDQKYCWIPIGTKE